MILFTNDPILDYMPSPYTKKQTTNITMASTRSRKLSAWNKAVRSAWNKGAKNFTEAVKMAKKTYKPKSSPSKAAPKPCPKGTHRRMRGRGSRCVKN